jgi:hypothetical protein
MKMPLNDFEKFGWETKYNGSVKTRDGRKIVIYIQNGPRKEVGENGVDIEVLGELWLDILKDFNSGEYRCRENSITITKLEEALMWQQKRRENRIKREVEGTENP